MAKIRLSDEERDALQAADESMAEAAEAIRELDAMGVDVGELKAKLESVEKIRKGLLEHF